ncbi:hypothetical protein HZA57_00545 [Candidatus Poribacteria bacterium]|nr:hypothetical protein [Candidatus Poribacteria bacterium]
MTRFEMQDPFTWTKESLGFDVRIYTYHEEQAVMEGGPASMNLYPHPWRGYILWSLGPNVYFDINPGSGQAFSQEYDPTNGTISEGGVYYFGEG